MPPRILYASVSAVLAAAALGCGDEAPTAPGVAQGVTPALAAAAGAVKWIQVSSGDGHTCALTADHAAWCWGANSQGQLGDGTQTRRLTPVAVAGGHRFAQIATGGGHSCGITDDNRAWCWGQNNWGQLGNGSQYDFHTLPVAVAGGRRYRQIRAGMIYTCALTTGDKAFCWGNNDLGQMGAKSLNHLPTPVLGGLTFRQIVTGASHTCAVTREDRAYCWGANNFGQLGDGTIAPQRNQPAAVAGGIRFVHVVPGAGWYPDFVDPFVDDGHTCGLGTDDKVYCWGLRNFSIRTPRDVSGTRRFRQVTTGFSFTCGVALSRAAYCWDILDVQTLVPGGLLFSSLSTGTLGNHICGLTTDGRVYCWGANNNGQLGDGTTTNRAAPVAIATSGS